MQKTPTTNNRVPLREYLEYRFNRLEEMFGDHEKRLRRLERQAPLSWIATVVVAVASAFGIKTGYSPP